MTSMKYVPEQRPGNVTLMSAHFSTDVLYGTKHETSGSDKPSGFGNLQEIDVPCAVCRRRGKSSVIIIPGKCLIF